MYVMFNKCLEIKIYILIFKNNKITKKIDIFNEYFNLNILVLIIYIKNLNDIKIMYFVLN